MYMAGYDVMLASDLSKHTDQVCQCLFGLFKMKSLMFFSQSTIIFKKSVPERQQCEICCVAPGGFDKIILVRHTFDVREAIGEAIEAGWELGIDNEKSETICHEDILRFKLNGMPWSSSGEESAPTRKLVGAIIEKMAIKGWHLLAPINLKGITDSFFFVHYPEQVL